MDEARRERIKTIFDKHTAPDRRIALLGEIPSRVVARNDTVTTIELLEWLLQNTFSIDLIVAFTPDRETAVCFKMGIVSSKKKNVPTKAQYEYSGHFIARKSNNEIISYGKRILTVPGDTAWRVLLQLEIQLPTRRSLIGMPAPPESFVPTEFRPIFETYETSNLLLKDRKILDVLKQQFPTEQWVMAGIHKFHKTPPELQEMEEVSKAVQALDLNPMNLFGMTKEMVDQLPLEWKKEFGKLENIQKESDASKDLFKLLMQTVDNPIEAEAFIRAQLERDPRQDLLWLMLGSLLAGQFRWEEALRAFKKAKDLDPTEPLCKDCIGITLDALGEEPYQGKWEIKDLIKAFREQTQSLLRHIDVTYEDDENIYRRESFQRTLKALTFHYYQKDPKKGEEAIEKLLSKCDIEEKIYFLNNIAWQLYSQHTKDINLLELGKSLAARGVALAKKNKSKLLVCCLDSQACLASLLGEYKESKLLFEEAINVNRGGRINITWKEFARVLNALGDDVNYKMYEDFF